MKPLVKAQPGYMALTSIIILSLFSMALVFTVSFAGFSTRQNINSAYSKNSSYDHSSSCANIALRKALEDKDYVGGETIPLGTYQCQILLVETNGTQKTVKTKAIDEYTTTNLVIMVDMLSTGPVLLQWKEIPVL